ncbi:hypothetical protein AAG906_025587 [Vitis piasezkii]
MMILLGCMDIDLALRMPKPDELNEQSTQEDEVYWGAVTDEVTNADDFLGKFETFAKSDKVETSTLLASLISMKYKGKGNVRVHHGDVSSCFKT